MQEMNGFPKTYLELMIRISRELANSLDLNRTLEQVLFLSTKAVGAESGSLVVLDSSRQPVDSAMVVNNQLITGTTIQMAPTLMMGLAGWVLQHNQAVLVRDTRLDERWLKQEDDLQVNANGKSAICVPLIAADQIAGILTIVHNEPGYFDSTHLGFLQAIADQAAMALHNAQLYHQLEAAHSRYQELFQDSIDPIFISAKDGKILEANRQAVLISGYHLADLKEHVFIFSPLQANETYLLTATPPDDDGTPDPSKVMTYESSLINKSGEVIPVLVNTRPLKIDGAAQIQWIIRDISEIKKLRQYQEDSVAMIYHDLRSPIANIISAVDILHSMHLEQKDPGVTSLIHILSRSTDRMQRLTSNLLDFKFLEAGQAVIKRKLSTISEIVTDAVQTIQLGAESKAQQIQVNVEPGLPELYIDTDMLKRVLINLLENASKFTPREGLIQVTATQTDGNILFSVRDSGPGIPPDAMQLIFEKFVTFSPDKQTRSMGIGLAFCRLAVEAHGGKIWAESDPGNGSNFQFILPVALNQQEA